MIPKIPTAQEKFLLKKSLPQLLENTLFPTFPVKLSGSVENFSPLPCWIAVDNFPPRSRPARKRRLSHALPQKTKTKPDAKRVKKINRNSRRTGTFRLFHRINTPYCCGC